MKNKNTKIVLAIAIICEIITFLAILVLHRRHLRHNIDNEFDDPMNYYPTSSKLRNWMELLESFIYRTQTRA